MKDIKQASMREEEIRVRKERIKEERKRELRLKLMSAVIGLSAVVLGIGAVVSKKNNTGNNVAIETSIDNELSEEEYWMQKITDELGEHKKKIDQNTSESSIYSGAVVDYKYDELFKEAKKALNDGCDINAIIYNVLVNMMENEEKADMASIKISPFIKLLNENGYLQADNFLDYVNANGANFLYRTDMYTHESEVQILNNLLNSYKVNKMNNNLDGVTKYGEHINNFTKEGAKSK